MTVEVFDPEMCCTSGVCGPAPDPALVAFSRLLDELRAQGAQVARYQLSRQPQAFVRNQDVYRLVLERGIASLPVVAVDGRIVSIGHYPGPDALGAHAAAAASRDTTPARGCGCSGGTACR
ncbi:MAG: arsenite efflux transporter metallochaperone ArsD [Firmicutes bacterium]|nr:arsenite efflux transporter metallochaperone ArsD [Bacillota bacterium]